MATVAPMKGGASKAFKANSKSRVNDLVDSKTFEASTKAKGMQKDMPAAKKAQATPGAAPNTAQAKGKAAPAVAKQAAEVVGSKGGKVDQKA